MDFTPVCDSLATLIQEQCGVEGKLKVKSIMRRGTSLDFYFTESLGDFPWNKSDIKWFRTTLKSLFPENYSKNRLGEIYSRKVNLDRLAMPALTYDGKPAETRYKVKESSRNNILVRKLGSQKFDKGLSGRHIALWQSHGRYFDQDQDLWSWQRPCLFGTCEDMFTQSFVLPYLVPMLENAGAYVMLPRERDIQKNEVIADNDPTAGGRGEARYTEKGKWEDAGVGFADLKPVYMDLENPFETGTVRKSPCVSPSSAPTASATWTPTIPERGEYAVYVSYKSLPNSTSAAHYTVHHLGGKTEFAVDQRIGGGTWIYLGTFEFEAGESGYVTLDNHTPKGNRFEVGATVTADAVKFGGGMGNIARSRFLDPNDTTTIASEPTISGMPRSAEAARYWLQWAGVDSTIYYQNEGKNDYRDDFMSRGDWSEWMDRELGIPIDLTLGFHTDAGVTPNDSLIGTLAIYTYRSERKTEYPSGEDRMTSRMYADIVQNQIVNDIRASYDTLWAKRSIWDRSYRESRTPSSPAILIELLSHQNLADMKYGLDPSFKFDVSRAIYKGMLKYLSNRYQTEYVVQPLPVSSIGAEFGKEGKAVISWRPEDDPLEPTAVPEGYILYTRKGNGGFDQGTIIKNAPMTDGICSYEVALVPGEVMSFKVAAFNKGGEGFPSETVSIGVPAERNGKDIVLIVNNFDRTGGATLNGIDGGVPHIRDISFVGEMHNFNRDDEWISNDCPGFGASYSDMAGEIIAGNTFDYPSVHGKAVLAAGYPFYSCSNERFCNDSTFSCKANTLDIICGKQTDIFTGPLTKSVRDFASRGGNILISGSYIGTFIQNDETKAFANEVLGYKHITGKASRKGRIVPAPNKAIRGLGNMQVVMNMNPEVYCIEYPDGIAPASTKGHTILRYPDSNISAGVAYQGEGYRTVSLGFPIEVLSEEDMITGLMENIMNYFNEHK
jgi:hypothetical protein